MTLFIELLFLFFYVRRRSQIYSRIYKRMATIKFSRVQVSFLIRRAFSRELWPLLQIIHAALPF